MNPTSTQSKDAPTPTAPMPFADDRCVRLDRTDVKIALALAIITLAVFLPAVRFEFVAYDDPGYVYENPQVMAGLTWPSVSWAWTTGAEGNWHPLTWMSHMLDVSLFGNWAGGHHLTAVLIHAANAVLVFIALRLLSGAAWRSASVALLFAVHPLRVESVAWVSERKDVLSTFFALLAIAGYAMHARRWGTLRAGGAGGTRRTGDRRWMAMTIGCHALSLLAKPMFVTLPALLLLLDAWPLRRWGVSVTSGPAPERDTEATPDAPMVATPQRSFALLVIEKLPLVALSLASCVVTVMVQRGNMPDAELVAPVGRLANAVVAYVQYLGKLALPSQLACFYPHPGRWSPMAVAGSAGLLVAITAALAALARRWPAGIIGWLWYVGMLLPAIGIVQVGLQSMADRYTYFPCIGVLIMVVWGIADGARRINVQPYACAVSLAMVALVFILATLLLQLPTWRNTRTLFEHAVTVTGPNAVSSYNLGNEYARLDRSSDAIGAYEAALRAGALNPKLHNNLGIQLQRVGRYDAAVSQFRRALELSPKSLSAMVNLATVLAMRPESMQEALQWFERASHLAPERVEVSMAWARALATTGNLPAAAEKFESAAKQRPGWAEPHNALGVIYARRGMMSQAIACFRRAVEAEPTNADAQANLRRALLTPIAPVTQPAP